MLPPRWTKSSSGYGEHLQNKYRLDNESRQLQDLERRGNQRIDVPSAQHEGVYFGFQGATWQQQNHMLSYISHMTTAKQRKITAIKQWTMTDKAMDDDCPKVS